ncbi:MAG: tRNA pseudouridine(38-40) synthase TruA [bacterium]|nr:tRNA pseudouridine(38-40) synthase TruA [bacterium]
MPGRNIKLIIEYEGSNYAGWQIQKEQVTVQGLLTEAVTKITGCEVSITGAGRTDAGVHALGQTANFRIDHRLEPERYAEAMNYYLPDDIRVQSSTEVADSFNSRFDAVWRRYRYLLSSRRTAIFRKLRWERRGELDYGLLRQGADLILGEHDFRPFCVVASQKEDNRCRIYQSRWYRWGDLMVYEIRGNRFLHSMVRSLVGAMVNLARTDQDENPHNLTLARFADILQSGNEERIVFTAPAHGLYLRSVGYGKDKSE